MTKVDAWSYSRLSCYELCPAQYKYRNIEKLAEPKSEAMQRGIDIHKECEKFLLGEGPITDNMRKFEDEFEQMAAYFEPIVEQKWAFDNRWRNTGFFTKGDKAAWLRVIPDAVILYEDDTATMIDFKTGKKYGEYEDQMSLFADAMFCRYSSLKEVDIRLWFLDTGDEVPFTAHRKGLADRKAEWLERIDFMFNDTEFLPRPNDKCKWCHFSGKHNNGPCEY